MARIQSSMVHPSAKILYHLSKARSFHFLLTLPSSAASGTDCSLWDRFGKDFAYIHTGISETQIAGTTLAVAKLGSGLNVILDPCIEKFLETESYYNLCVKYDLVDLCFPNRFFPNSTNVETQPIWTKRTSELITSCSDGYCSCPATVGKTKHLRRAHDP